MAERHAPSALTFILLGPEIPSCEWFLLCTRPSAGVVSHPVLEYVPTCRVCADRLGLDLHPWEGASA